MLFARQVASINEAIWTRRVSWQNPKAMGVKNYRCVVYDEKEMWIKKAFWRTFAYVTRRADLQTVQRNFASLRASRNRHIQTIVPPKNVRRTQAGLFPRIPTSACSSTRMSGKAVGTVGAVELRLYRARETENWGRKRGDDQRSLPTRDFSCVNAFARRS